MKTSLTYFFLFVSFQASAQNPSSEPVLSQGEVNHILNKAFNKLVADNSNPGEIANYATVDPINASFNIKGTIPMRHETDPKYKDSSDESKLGKYKGRISYLSFAVSGGLTDKKYGVLFSDSKLNAGLSFSAQYNFQLGKSGLSYSDAEWTSLAMSRSRLINTYHNNRAALETQMRPATIQVKKNFLDLQLVSDRNKLRSKQIQKELLEKTIDSLGDEVRNRSGLIDTLKVVDKEIDDLTKNFTDIKASTDSISLLLQADIDGQKGLLRKEMDLKLKNDFDTLLSRASILEFKIAWFTLIGGYSRTGLTTFDRNLPFESQIGSRELNGYNFGVAINQLKQDKLKNRIRFFTGSLSRIESNNLQQLATSTIDQDKTITNSAGDTVRTISKKISAYTDPVMSTMAWNISANAYYLFGKTPSGIHLFPSINFQNHGHRIADFTIGYVISFRNTVKDQPLLNSEFYIHFKNIFNDGDVTSKFYNRNEIGILFTVPFNIF